MDITASFVRSAASAGDLPRDGLDEIAVVGRSNVGKSSLINALVRRRLARTSAEPGKTRLANIYKVARRAAAPFYLIDLPGYGYARGGAGSSAFAVLADEYFGRPAAARIVSGLLLVDGRHPGLAADLEAWRWMATVVSRRSIVATKIDKLTRAERLRALSVNEAVFEHPVLPVSAATGEGLDQLWRLIERMVSSGAPRRPSRKKASPPARPDPTAAQAPRQPLQRS